MTLEFLIERLGFELVQGEFENLELTEAYTSDLLSDVMAHARDAQILITIQAHKNTVAVASLLDMRCIIICHNRPIPPEMAAAAQEEGIALIHTGFSQFEVSGRLYALLHAS